MSVMRRDAVAGLVEEDRDDVVLVRAVHEAVGDHDLGHGVVRPAGMPAEALRVGDGGEEHDRVAAEVDVETQRLALLVGERRRCAGRAQAA